MTSTFIQNFEFKAKIVNSLEEIETKYEKINLILHENLYPLDKDSYHFIGKMLKQLSPTDRITNAFTSTLFKNVYYGELTSAGSSEIAFKFGINFCKELLKNDLTNVSESVAMQNLEVGLETIRKLLEKETKIATQDDIEKTISLCCGGDRVLMTAVVQAINLAGLEGKIFVENGRQANFLVELKDGYNFSVKPFKFMLSKNNFWEANNCKVIVIDGLVEKISELDQILLGCMETKSPMAIFAHGFSEEVVATLKVNMEKGILNIQPIRIPTDVDSLNVANDIATVCGTQPLSFMKGDLLAFKKYEDLSIITKIRLYENKCSIENHSTRSSVSEQIKMLLEKRQAHFLHEEVQELYDKRVRSLTSSGVTIHLPSTSTNVLDEMRVKIDLSLRQVKTIINYGTVNLHNVSKEIDELLAADSKNEEDKIKIILLKTIADTYKKGRKIKPFLSSYIGCELTARPLLMLLLSSGFVMLD